MSIDGNGPAQSAGDRRVGPERTHRAAGDAMRWARGVPALVALALGVAACTGGNDAADRDAGAASPGSAAAPVTMTIAPAPSVGDDAVGLPASSPTEAVEEFVAAEATRDHQRAFALLAATDRAAAGSAAGWRAAHKAMPRLRGVTIGTVSTTPTAPGLAVVDGANAVTVDGTVAFEPQLDDVVGLVPAQADARWVVVPEDGGWRVDWAESTFRGRYPARNDHTVDDAVRRAVENWIVSRRACPSGPVSGEYAGGLLGSVGLAGRLCRTSGAVRTAAVLPLGDAQSATVVAAFGPEADLWARSVDVDAGVALRAVVAPLGDTWVVLGVFPAAPAVAGR